MKQLSVYILSKTQVCFSPKAINIVEISSKDWYDHCKEILSNTGLTFSLYDKCLFYNEILIIGLIIRDYTSMI